MDEDEQLREALLELEVLRGREAERLRETRALLTALEVLTASEDVDDGIAALLSSIQQSLGCDAVALFESEGETLVLRHPAATEGQPTKWVAPGLLTRPRRIVDLHRVKGLWETPPGALAQWRSLLSVPLANDDQCMVLIALSRETGGFSASDAELLDRLAAVASQALLRRALEKRNAFLAAVINRSPVSVAVAEASGELPLVYVNDAFVELTGYSRSEILGQNCRLLSAEEKDSPVRTAIRETVAARGSGTFVVRNRRKDGTEFWNELQLFPVSTDGAEVSHMIATQTDATQRIQAEIDRDEARRRLESALTATSEAFLILGKRGHVRFVNATFASLFHHGDLVRDEILSPKVAARILDRPETGLPDKIADAFRAPVSHEIVAPDDRQLLLRARPIPDGGAVVAATDITQLKVNERMLRQRLAAIEISQDGIAICDLEGRIVDMNPSLLTLWSVDDDAMAIGRQWTSFYDETSVEAFRADEGRFQRTGVWRGEAEIAVHDKKRTHDVSLSLVPDVGSVLIVRDVTDRLRDVAERAEMRRRLDRAQMQERLHQLSAGLAHDLNNLLSAILGSASLIEATPGLPNAGQEAVTRIQSAAGRAADLIDGFLDLGSRERTAEIIDLRRVLESTVDLARGGAPSDVRLSARLPASPLRVEASQTDLLQIVMNLVVNGIDALNGMGGEVRVTLREPTSPPDDARFIVGSHVAGRSYAGIDVEDTGNGMSPDTVQQILEPYFTTKGNIGTGLGLSIVSSIIADNDGLLEIDTKEGVGTRLTVWWPIERGEMAHPSPQRVVRANRAHLPVLVLDDAPEVAASVASKLADANYEVAETSDPEIALEAILENPANWGCLITDYDMPGLTGGDLIERLALVAPDLPIIVVSALARRLNDRRLAGASSVLQKPVRGDTLLAAVREATGASDLTRESIGANSSGR